jgi:hypothetical protein
VIRKPLKFDLVLNFRRGDRVRINRHPFHTGTISSIDAHMTFSDAPFVIYCVRTDTPCRVCRYVGEEDLQLIEAREERLKAGKQ